MNLPNVLDSSLERQKMRSDDRILVIRPMEGKQDVDSRGLIDPRIFKGEGKNLHGVMDPATCLWEIKYEHGALPLHLKGQQFTNFSKLLAFAREYFNKRNLEIVEVID